MRSQIVRAVAALATATICAVPVEGSAGTAQSASQTAPRAAQAETATALGANALGATAQGAGPADHLREARRVLNDVLTVPVSGSALARLTELRTAYIDLERAWAAAAGSPISGTPEWAEHHATIERALSDLLEMTSAQQSDESAGAVGTGGTGAGTTTGTSGSNGAIDAAMANRLREFQRHLQAFNDAALATTPPPNITTTPSEGTPPPPSAPTAEPTPAATAPVPAAEPTPAATAPIPAAEPTPAAATGNVTNAEPANESAGTASPDTNIVALLDEVEALLNELLPTPAGMGDPRVASMVNITVDRARLEQLLRRVRQTREGLSIQ